MITRGLSHRTLNIVSKRCFKSKAGIFITSSIIINLEEVLQHYKLKSGFEIHCQLMTNTKLFSYGLTPSLVNAYNTCADYVDMALPGMLPVLNEECLRLAIKASLALQGTIGNKNEDSELFH